jgi:chemotaxis protein methyltransferase CheR
VIPNLLRDVTSNRLREFAFGNEDFEALRTLVKQITGINLSDQKRELVYGRLARRLRALQLKSFAEYRELLSRDGGREIAELCNAITTNLTAFFREPHHFDYLRDQVLLPLAANAGADRRLRIWSAGCSTGEEPYSIAMTVLERGHRGMYAADRVRGLNSQRIARFFTQRQERDGSYFQVSPEVASLVTFKQLNLMHPLPMKGPLQAIFCRNVIIYFDKETQRDLFARVSRLQRPGQLLFLGHSESLFKVSEDYNLIGRTVHRRN